MIRQTAALLVSITSLLSASAGAATCSPSLIGNGICDCGCADSDCPTGDFDICQSNQCGAGRVPWEHSPAACMGSACGDGWNDPAAGEVCDDGNALASGGCSANCKAVNPGYACGERASGCHLAPVDAGTSAPDAGVADSGSANGSASDAGIDAGQPESDAGQASPADGGTENKAAPQGCTAVLARPLLVGALILVGRRRRAARRAAR